MSSKDCFWEFGVHATELIPIFEDQGSHILGEGEGAKFCRYIHVMYIDVFVEATY